MSWRCNNYPHCIDDKTQAQRRSEVATLVSGSVIWNDTVWLRSTCSCQSVRLPLLFQFHSLVAVPFCISPLRVWIWLRSHTALRLSSQSLWSWKAFFILFELSDPHLWNGDNASFFLQVDSGCLSCVSVTAPWKSSSDQRTVLIRADSVSPQAPASLCWKAFSAPLGILEVMPPGLVISQQWGWKLVDKQQPHPPRRTSLSMAHMSLCPTCLSKGPELYWVPDPHGGNQLVIAFLLGFPSLGVCVRVCVIYCFSRVRVSVTPRIIACQALLSMRFSRQEYCRGFPCSFPGDLPDPGIEPTSLALQANALLTELLEQPFPSLCSCPNFAKRWLLFSFTGNSN